MGFFRKLKAARYSVEECRKNCERILAEMLGAENVGDLEKMAKDWAIWRECQARKEGENGEEIGGRCPFDNENCGYPNCVFRFKCEAGRP